MAYLGQKAHETKLTNRTVDTMTGDGSDTTLTLSTAPISVNNVLVFIDGVMQRPTTDYTVSGTTLTFAVAPHNSANVQAITGGGEHIGVPLAPITEDQLVDGAITASKLVSGITIPASKIESLAANKLTGALPALAGGNLTNMPPTSIGIDIVTSDPTASTNPDSVGTIQLNKTTGEMYVCTSKATNNNVWKNVGEGSGDITNTRPTNPTSTNTFPDIVESTSSTFQFSGATDASPGSVTHYKVDTISNAALTVTTAEVADGSSHTFTTNAVNADTPVTFRVRAKDNQGAYSTGVTVSMSVLNVVYTVASGGVESEVGDYRYHTFNSDGTFTVTTAGTENLDFLVLAGGGGGGGGPSTYYGGGGGGAGGYLSSLTSNGGGAGLSSSLTPQTYAIVVGAGEPGADYVTNTGTSGSDSKIGSAVVAAGGGGGGSARTTGGNASSDGRANHGVAGGCGGGGSGGSSNGAGNGGSGSQGYAGGSGNDGSSPGGQAGGGGGGSGSIGTNAGPNGGNGGNGLAWVDGTSRGGGGGAGVYSGSVGTASSGGGAGGTGNGNHGTDGKGGGGGGGSATNSTGGNGGDGVVIIRYKFRN